MQALAGDFADRNAVCRWTGKYRVVDGCTSAYILYVSEIPSLGFRQHALTGVTCTDVGNAWLSIADQGSLLR